MKPLPKRKNLFSEDNFKLPSETLVKTAIDNYIKNLTEKSINKVVKIVPFNNTLKFSVVNNTIKTTLDF